MLFCFVSPYGDFFCTVLSNDMLALTTTSEYSVPMVDTNIKM